MIPLPNERVTGAGIISTIDGGTLVPCSGYAPPARLCAWRMFYVDLGLAMQAVGAQLIMGWNTPRKLADRVVTASMSLHAKAVHAPRPVGGSAKILGVLTGFIVKRRLTLLRLEF